MSRPELSAFPVNDALRLAQFALGIYPAAPEIARESSCIQLPGASCETITVDNLEARFYPDGARGILVFQGTNDADDWVLNNLEGGWHGEPPRYAGFMYGWQELWQPLIAVLKKHADGMTELEITGHSLGGALAIIAAYELARDFPVTRVITYAAPRAGGEAFREAFRKRETHRGKIYELTWQIKVADDVVTWVPPSILGYRHAAKRLIFAGRRGSYTNPYPTEADKKKAEAQRSFGEMLRDYANAFALAIGKVLGPIGALFAYLLPWIFRWGLQRRAAHHMKHYIYALEHLRLEMTGAIEKKIKVSIKE